MAVSPAGAEVKPEVQKALATREAELSVALSVVQQAGGNRQTRWSSLSELRNTANLRGEKDVANRMEGLLWTLQEQGKVESYVDSFGVEWIRRL